MLKYLKLQVFLPYLIVRRQGDCVVDGNAVEDELNGGFLGRRPPPVLLVLLEDLGRSLLGQPRVQRRRHLRRRRRAELLQPGPGPCHLKYEITD